MIDHFFELRTLQFKVAVQEGAQNAVT